MELVCSASRPPARATTLLLLTQTPLINSGQMPSVYIFIPRTQHTTQLPTYVLNCTVSTIFCSYMFTRVLLVAVFHIATETKWHFVDGLSKYILDENCWTSIQTTIWLSDCIAHYCTYSSLDLTGLMLYIIQNVGVPPVNIIDRCNCMAELSNRNMSYSLRIPPWVLLAWYRDHT